MIVTIHQPDFVPWLGFFDRWKKSDLYVILDNVQFLRRGWHHRDKIKTANGVQYLTVPVIKKGKFNQEIRDVEIDYGSNWCYKHLKTIELNYRKAPHFEYFYEKVKEIYDKKPRFLVELNLSLLHFMAGEMAINTPVVYASDYPMTSSTSLRLVELVEAVGGTYYLTGLGAKDYLDESIFKKKNIQVMWQQFRHPVYKQLHGEFIAMLSSLDYLMMTNNLI